jgi:hypothetical protein
MDINNNAADNACISQRYARYLWESVRLFHGEDLLGMLRAGKFCMWYGQPESLPDVQTFENVQASDFLILKYNDGTGKLTFNVSADVVFKEDQDAPH